MPAAGGKVDNAFIKCYYCKRYRLALCRSFDIQRQRTNKEDIVTESRTHLDENASRPNMADFDRVRAIIIGTVLTLSTIISVAIWIATDLASLAAAIFVLSFGGFLIQAIARIDPERNEVAIPIVGEKFVSRLIGPGWIFIPLRGFFFLDFMMTTGMNLSNRSASVIMLPDDKEIEVPITTNFMINPHDPIPFIRLGQTLEDRIAEIDKRFDEQIGQHLRQWLCSKTEGPQNFDDAREMKDEAILAILEKVMANDMKQRNPNLTNQEVVSLYRHRTWLEPEHEVRKRFNALSQPEQDKAMEDAKGLVAIVNDVRNGQHEFPLMSLGVIITRLVIGNIEQTEETRAGMLSVSKADWDAQAQAKTAQSVAAEAALYAKASPIPIDTVKTTLIRRQIVKEDIKVNEVRLSPNVTDTITALGTQLMNKLFANAGGGKDSGNGSNNPGTGTANSPANP